jgi:NRPS condensation-like uncharacterized protein
MVAERVGSTQAMQNAELPDVVLFGSTPRFGDLAIHAAIDLRRAFSRAELERAASAAVSDFPVLGRRYEPRFWRDRWAPALSPLSEAVHVVDAPADLDAETLAWIRRPIVAIRDRPFRIVSLRRGAVGSRLLLSILHLAVDGAGAAAVAHVLAARLYGVAPSLPVDRSRGVVRTLTRLRYHHLPLLLKDFVVGLAQPLRMRAAGKRERAYAPNSNAHASYRHLTIAAPDLARIRARVPSGTATVNDVLVAALARMAAMRSSSGPVPVLYTMNLRRYAHTPRLTAANTSSILSVLVPRRATADLSSALAAARDLTAQHRRGLAGPAFILAPTVLASCAPHAFVRRSMRLLHPVVVDVAIDRGLVVTNVGKLDEGLRPFGEDIEDIRVFGPNIEGVSVPAVIAYGFRGQLHLELFGPAGLALEALDEFEAELYAALELAPEHRRRPADAPDLDAHPAHG